MHEEQYIPPSNYEKPIENRLTNQAIRLLRLIKSELNPESFSLAEIEEEFNQYSDKRNKFGNPIVKYSQNTLDYLVKHEFLGINEDGSYYLIRDKGEIFT